MYFIFIFHGLARGPIGLSLVFLSTFIGTHLHPERFTIWIALLLLLARASTQNIYTYTAARVRVGFVLQMSPAAAMLVMQASTEFASAHSHELTLWNWIYKNTQLARDFSSRQIYMISPPFNTPFNSAVCCASYLYRKKIMKNWSRASYSCPRCLSRKRDEGRRV